jgi:hypothetical protein
MLIIFTSGCKKNTDNSSGAQSQKYISGDIWFNAGYNTLCQTSDNGFAIASLVGIHRIYVAKTNASFDILWSKTYGANIYDVGGIIQSGDGGFVVIANLIDTIWPEKKYVDLIKLNSSGDLLWEKKYQFRYQYKDGFALRETPDKGFIITTAHDDLIELFRINANGDSLWSHKYPGYSSTGHDIQVTSDNGFIAVGEQIVLKTDSLGNMLWEYFDQEGVFTNVRILPDGSYIVLGSKFFYPTDTSGTSRHYMLMKLDASGTKLWEKLYKVGNNESSANLCLTPEGGFIFTGMTDVAAGNDEIVAIKTDGDGNQLSLKIINEGSYPEAWGLVWQNGSYVYYGGTTSGGAGYFLRLMRFNM